MTDAEYLEAVLRDQTLAPLGQELKDLEAQREAVTEVLARELGHANPKVQKGGSWAKHTMIREAYDLDLPTYFDHDENGAGESLEEICNNVADAMSTEYFVERRRSALRLHSKDATQDTHIDLVPGRYFDTSQSDAWIYQNNGDKCRLKTNLGVHVAHIRDSGVRPAIRLSKLWNVRKGVKLKTFVLELLVVDLLKNRKESALDKQLVYLFEQFRDHAEDLSIVDPANANNDLTPALNAVKIMLVADADSTLRNLEHGGWESVFGPVRAMNRQAAAAQLTAAVPNSRQYQPHAT